MKNLIILLLLFTFVFATPENAPLNFIEKRKKLNTEINQCVINRKISDKVKTLIQAAPEEDIRKTLKPIWKEMVESDLEIIRNCRRTLLQKFRESLYSD